MDFWSAAILVHVGAFFYVIGFLVRDELALRLLVLVGTIFYLLYYFLFPSVPLWDAIITTCILGSANLFIISRVIIERTTLGMTDDMKSLYEHFTTLTPGQFRSIYKLGTHHVADKPTLLCNENGTADKLYFLQSGGATVSKNGANFEIPSGIFLGEIAFILDGKYSADVNANPQSQFYTWDFSALRKIMSKKPDLNNAMIALFNKDLASKLAVSHQT